jgi:hypothetical protein
VIDAAEAVARLERSTGAFLEVLDGVSEREWDVRPPGEAWSLEETVEHVVITDRLVFPTPSLGIWELGSAT